MDLNRSRESGQVGRIRKEVNEVRVLMIDR